MQSQPTKADLTKAANRLLRKNGFFKAAARNRKAMRRDSRVNPDSICGDGHLSLAKAFR